MHNGDSDHEASLNAILSGLLKRSTPGYLLHLSGTGIVSDWRDETYLGKLNPKVWSDIHSLPEIASLPDEELHRNTEIILHQHIKDHSDKINIAIICPPDIYGPGKGLAKTHSALVPWFVQVVKDHGGRTISYKESTNTRSWVHIDDLVCLYLYVVETAAAGKDASKYFNANGYYFASTQEHSQVEFARATGAILHKYGVIQDPEPVQVGLEDLDKMIVVPGYPKLARYLFAANSRTRAERAGKLFGYKGEAPGLMEVLESDILGALKQ